MTFLGWYDPDKKHTPTEKLASAAFRYLEKFDSEPDVALVNPADAEAIANDPMRPKNPSFEIQAVNYVPVNVFYIGKKS